MPTGSTIIGSRWEIYSPDETIPVYTGENNNAGNYHAVSTKLPEGNYVWRVAYEWIRYGNVDVRNSTNWSEWANIVVAERGGSGIKDGVSGCNAGIGALSVLVLTFTAGMFGRSKK